MDAQPNKLDTEYYDLKVGYTCNCNCIHCFIADRREYPDLSTEKIKEIIDTIKPGTMITVTGGEPTIRPDIVEILKYIREKGSWAYVQTNGLALADEELARQVAQYSNMIVFTFHSHIKDIHEAILSSYVHDNAYELSIKAMENLAKLDVRVDTQTVITKQNLPYLRETFDVIQEKLPGVQMRLTFPHTVGNASDKLLIPTYTEVAPVVQDILKKWNKFVFTTYIPLCYIYPYHDARSGINHHDEYVGVSVVDRGYDHSVKDGKHMIGDEITSYIDIAVDGKIKSPECAKCVFDNRCMGVWRQYAELFGYLDVVPIEKIDSDLVAEVMENTFGNDNEYKVQVNNVDEIFKLNGYKTKNNITVITDVTYNNIAGIYKLYEALSNTDYNIKRQVFNFPPNTTIDGYIPVSKIKEELIKYNVVDMISAHQTRIIPFTNNMPACVVGYHQNFIKNNDPEVKHLKTQFGECNHCSIKNMCGGIFKDDLDRFGTEGLSAI